MVPNVRVPKKVPMGTKANMMKKLKYSKVGTKANANAPLLLTVGGIAFMGLGAVLTWRSAIKTQDILAERRQALDEIKQVRKEYKEAGAGDKYTPRDVENDTKMINVQTGVAVVKTVAPAVGCLVAGAFMIGKGHSILSKRYATMTAAFNGVSSLFNEYRDRVKADLGEDKDLEYRYGINKDKLKLETNELNKDGSKKKKTEEVLTDDGSVKDKANSIDMMSVFYDEGAETWQKSPYYNLCTIKGVMDEVQRRVDMYGYCTLGWAFDRLGIHFPSDDPREGIAQGIGWLKHGKRSGGHVDFGVYDLYSAAARGFVNGHERNILLQFNHDGYILDQIGKLIINKKGVVA